MLLKLLKTIAVDALYLLMWPKHLLAKMGFATVPWLLLVPLLLVWWAVVALASLCAGCWIVLWLTVMS
jgi:hypothetical protein